jgi:hypothetical protein
MATGEERHQDLVEHRLLADNPATYLVPQPRRGSEQLVTRFDVDG